METELGRKIRHEVALRVEDFAPDDILDEMEIEDAFQLTGLYDGVPLTERDMVYGGQLPDRIVVFRGPLGDHTGEAGGQEVEELGGGGPQDHLTV